MSIRLQGAQRMLREPEGTSRTQKRPDGGGGCRCASSSWHGRATARSGGRIDLEDGRLSDQLNEREVVTFYEATLRSLADDHEVALDELEVERLELHLIPVHGRRGDPTKRIRTVAERVTLEIGPYWVTGNLHRLPTTQAARRPHDAEAVRARSPTPSS